MAVPCGCCCKRLGKMTLAMQADLAQHGLTLEALDALSRMPRGFEDLKGAAVAPALRLRSFIVRRPVDAEAPDLVARITGLGADALPLLRFGWDAVDEARG